MSTARRHWVPEQAYSRAILGVYEMTRVELLRDVYIWAYERSCQEYLAVKQDIVEPDPLRLAYRALIRKAIRDVVRQPARAPLDIIGECLSENDLGTECDNVKALILEELRRLHEGVLSRYGLRESDYIEWKSHQ